MIHMKYECFHCLVAKETDFTPEEAMNFRLPRYWCYDEDDRLFCTKGCMKAQKKEDREAAEEAARYQREDFAIRYLGRSQQHEPTELRFLDPPCVVEAIRNDGFLGSMERPRYNVVFSNGMVIKGIFADQIHLPEPLYPEELRV